MNCCLFWWTIFVVVVHSIKVDSALTLQEAGRNQLLRQIFTQLCQRSINALFFYKEFLVVQSLVEEMDRAEVTGVFDRMNCDQLSQIGLCPQRGCV